MDREAEGRPIRGARLCTRELRPDGQGCYRGEMGHGVQRYGLAPKPDHRFGVRDVMLGSAQQSRPEERLLSGRSDRALRAEVRTALVRISPPPTGRDLFLLPHRWVAVPSP